MVSPKRCCGLWGRVAGHNFQPVFGDRQVTTERGSVERDHFPSLLFCTRCGETRYNVIEDRDWEDDDGEDEDDGEDLPQPEGDALRVSY